MSPLSNAQLHGPPSPSPPPSGPITGVHFCTKLTPPGDRIINYEPRQGPRVQLHNIPEPFLHAMIVRQKVFVEEQKVPLINEFDDDDKRSCHWILYDTILDPTDKTEIPKEGGKPASPIGTIRLVPFPHYVHPKAGRAYYNGIIQPLPNNDRVPVPDDPNEPQGLCPWEYRDRPTTFHDGQELYLKLGRLAVVPTWRGHGVASKLITTALDFAARHPTSFGPPSHVRIPSGADGSPVRPHWRGLVCVHAQISAVGIWSKHGFKVDEKMGRWLEEGIEHVGMFRRLESQELKELAVREGKRKADSDN
ncbi:putative acetyltransferase, GNAT family [Coniochaeta sp. 2T2.1]|nr:putative acetyltransferase, GNAT family [Coniochaeta sp. 2T2.1]